MPFYHYARAIINSHSSKILIFLYFFFGIKIALVLTSRFRSLARAPAEEIKSRRDQTDSLEKGSISINSADFVTSQSPTLSLITAIMTAHAKF